MPTPPPRVFVSHASEDKAFVTRLTEDLKANNLDVWFDAHELKIGDSIVAGVDGGLREADYLIVVLSTASIASKWVMAELNSALMEQLSGKGTMVLPVLLETVEPPALLKDRLYADFTSESKYEDSLAKLLQAFEQESVRPKDLIEGSEQQAAVAPTRKGSDKCIAALGSLSLGDLRRMLNERLSRNEVANAWFDVFDGSLLDDDLPGRPRDACVMELLQRCRQRDLLEKLLSSICSERPDLSSR